MKQQGLKQESGFTVIEILIVLAIIGILVTFALINFDRSQTVLRRQNIALELKTYLERAKFDSVKRRATAPNLSEVTINSATSYTVRTDLDQNGTLEPGETRTLNFAQGSPAQFISSFPTTIAFDHRGYVQVDGNSVGTVTKLTLCSKNCTATGAEDNADTSTFVAVSPTGTVFTAPGGTALVNPSNPTIGTVNSNQGVNPMVQVNANIQ